MMPIRRRKLAEMDTPMTPPTSEMPSRWSATEVEIAMLSVGQYLDAPMSGIGDRHAGDDDDNGAVSATGFA